MSTSKAKLAGFLDPIRSRPGFILPVFEDGLDGEKNYYIQDIGIDQEILNFSKIHLDDEQQLIPPDADLTIGVSDPSLHAFAFSKNRVVAGTQSNLSRHLVQNVGKLANYPFVQLDMYRFLGALDRAQILVRRIRNKIAMDNVEAADQWARVQLASIDEQTGRNLYVPDKSHRIAIWNRSGFISYPELVHTVEHSVVRQDEVEVQVRLVRSCIGKTNQLKEHIRSLGLNPERCNVLSRPIRIERASYTLLERLSDMVMIVKCILRGDDVVIFSPVNESKTRRRYFKKRKEKRLAPRRGIDFSYSRDQ